jgi:sodium transport system permease protein
MGSMYPAIDLAAGEKERGTLETLLTIPVSRLEILLGKFCVVVITGLTSAVISIIGIFISLRQVNELPAELLNSVTGFLEPRSVILLVTLLIPVSIFFAALLLSVSFYAKSFKEAQSIISPMTILIIIPAFIGLLPGMNLNVKTALIPILNVSLAAQEILAGKTPIFLLAEVFFSLMVLAFASLLICTRLFEREDTIFRH